MRNTIILIICIIWSCFLHAQERQEILTFEEFLAFVKKNHPVAAQADLKLSEAEARVLEARGGFDPKIDIDYSTKEFKGTDYYDILYGSFKIPTWFGIELQAGYELNDGEFLNPQNFVPEDGLYSAGISVPVGQGLFINKRMASLSQAKIFRDLNTAERELQINQLLFEAVLSYLDWYRAWREYELYGSFLENAELRFRNLKREIEVGATAPIDSVELGITVQNRRLNLQNSALTLLKARLNLSNFLWEENLVPLEIAGFVRPQEEVTEALNSFLLSNENLIDDFDITTHPKIRSLRSKIETLEVERRLKAEMLKPELNLNYNFITSDAEQLNTINSGDYKFGLQFSMPIFLRKERGALELSKFKIQDAEFETEQEALILRNKSEAALQQVTNYESQRDLVDRVAEDYERLLQAEERKFSFGESSVFLLNSREAKLLEARLKQIELEYKLGEAQAELIRTLALPF
ncbi:TolC family protein [Robertkochia marina]|uniref:TolC family protein n=1 Tax=Robertkochia marina TaxID=1227945 RepID=A0A4S3LXN8_9FLAO|nr:TolC family protein [Robertkochia marina]THD66319.1 TolC family protein [Robertkochia marina]TRZ41239.1 TolC family protein [Robertkochia marina]